MAYATVQDMIDRFGQQEMIRLTTPDDQELDGVNAEVADAKLADASGVIDTYVGKRYRVPMDVPPAPVVRACCILARYDLACGGARNPSEQMTTQRADVMTWLRDVSTGKAVLELDEVAPSQESYAQASDRQAVFGNCSPWT